jgi:hypothetical protein
MESPKEQYPKRLSEHYAMGNLKEAKKVNPFES